MASGRKDQRIEIKTDAEWLERVKKEAERNSLEVSTYIRHIVTRHLNQLDEESKASGRKR